MSLSLLKARVSLSGADSEFVHSLTEMHQRTVTLGEGLRTLSHELHPGVLEHVGIVAALQSHSAAFERRQGVRIHVGEVLRRLESRADAPITFWVPSGTSDEMNVLDYFWSTGRLR